MTTETELLPPERIWTCGGTEGHFYTQKGHFAIVEYARTPSPAQPCLCGHPKSQHQFFSDHDECSRCVIVEDAVNDGLCCEYRPSPAQPEWLPPDIGDFALAFIREMYGPCPESETPEEERWHTRVGLLIHALTKYEELRTPKGPR